MQHETKDFTVAEPALAVGTHHAGFTITAIEPLPELAGTGYVMCHDATGARALWLATPDVNKSFAIAFKTPPADDTGVFHILEHSVLCGSDRFPVKEPFVNLLKTSMQTFLNALTFPDKTMYPVASTNEQDLENLMDVYLDAVLHPAIYHRPRIFEQEGWHTELVSEDGEPAAPGNADARLIYNGVVFNEMKGALSDPDEVLFEGISRALFPDTPYRFESGGMPRAIPQLSYEKFLDTHARHYNLPNSYTILYGDLDIERELAFIDRHFQKAADRGAAAPNPLPLQAPVTPELTRVEMATAPTNAAVGLAYVIGTSADRERVLAADILLDAIAGSNEAPLKRAVLAAGLGDDFTASLIDSELQPQVYLELKGAKPGVAEQFRTLVEKTCADLATGGIGAERLEASIAQAEFNLREGDFGGTPDGVALSMAVLSSWLYDDDDPVSYLRYEDALAHLKTGVATGSFEKLLTELVCESVHSAEVELVPVAAGASNEEAAELAAKKDALSEADLAAIADEVAALRAEQEAPDSPEDLAKLPQLAISDITEAPYEQPESLQEAPYPCYLHDLPTHGIDYLYAYFDLRRLTEDDLPYVGALTDLLSKLGTEKYDASALDTLLERNLGTLDFFVETYGRDDDPSFADPLLVVGASALSDKLDQLAALPAEVWRTTDFSDTDRMRDILTQRRIGLEQGFLGSGHAAAMARLSARYSAASAVADRIGRVDYYLWLKDLLAHWDERKDTLTARLAELGARIFTADEASFSFTGPAEDCHRFWEAAEGADGLPLGLRTLGADACAHRLVIPLPDPADPMAEAFTLPSDVCYVAEGQGRSEKDTGTIGSWQVAGRALSYDYLWNEVRVKGGAYGTGFRRTTAGLTQFWSYRDPGVDGTISRFERAADWLAHWDGSDAELEGYIVSTVATHDTPLKARQLARRQDSLRLSGRPDGWRDAVRASILATTADDLRALAPTLTDLPDRRSIVVFGGADQIAASGLPLQVTQLFGGDEDEA